MIGGGAVLLFIVLIVLFYIIKKHKKSKKEGSSYQEALIAETKPKTVLPAAEIILNETREQSLKKQIKDFSSTSPDIVAQLIRTWIKEGEDK